MTKSELAALIAEFIMSEKEMILEAIEKDDIQIAKDGAFDYIENCY
jgi:hypothetical protein